MPVSPLYDGEPLLGSTTSNFLFKRLGAITASLERFCGRLRFEGCLLLSPAALSNVAAFLRPTDSPDCFSALDTRLAPADPLLARCIAITFAFNRSFSRFMQRAR